jgi:hypothetical protein
VVYVERAESVPFDPKFPMEWTNKNQNNKQLEFSSYFLPFSFKNQIKTREHVKNTFVNFVEKKTNILQNYILMMAGGCLLIIKKKKIDTSKHLKIDKMSV